VRASCMGSQHSVTRRRSNKGGSGITRFNATQIWGEARRRLRIFPSVGRVVGSHIGSLHRALPAPVTTRAGAMWEVPGVR